MYEQQKNIDADAALVELNRRQSVNEVIANDLAKYLADFAGFSLISNPGNGYGNYVQLYVPGTTDGANSGSSGGGQSNDGAGVESDPGTDDPRYPGIRQYEP